MSAHDDRPVPSGGRFFPGGRLGLGFAAGAALGAGAYGGDGYRYPGYYYPYSWFMPPQVVYQQPQVIVVPAAPSSPVTSGSPPRAPLTL